MAKTKDHKGFVTLADLDGAPSDPLTMKEAKEKASKEGKPLHVKRRGSEKVLMEIKADGSIVRLIDKSRFSFKQEAPAEEPATPPAEEAGGEAQGGPQGGAKHGAKLQERLTPPKKHAPVKFRRVLEERVLIPAAVVIANGEVQAPEGHRGEFGRLVHKHKAPPVRGKRGVHKAPAAGAALDALVADLQGAGFAVVERP